MGQIPGHGEYDAEADRHPAVKVFIKRGGLILATALIGVGAALLVKFLELILATDFTPFEFSVLMIGSCFGLVITAGLHDILELLRRHQ